MKRVLCTFVFCIIILPTASVLEGRGSIFGTDFKKLKESNFMFKRGQNEETSETVQCEVRDRVADECQKKLEEASKNITVLQRQCEITRNPAFKEAPFTRRFIRTLLPLKQMPSASDISLERSITYEVTLSISKDQVKELIEFIDSHDNKKLQDMQDALIDGFKYLKTSDKSSIRLFYEYYAPDSHLYLITVVIILASSLSCYNLIPRLMMLRASWKSTCFMIICFDFLVAVYRTYLEELATDMSLMSTNTCNESDKLSVLNWILGKDPCLELNKMLLISPIYRVSLAKVWSKMVGAVAVVGAEAAGQSFQAFATNISWYFVPFALGFALLVIFVWFGFKVRFRGPFVEVEINNQRPQIAPEIRAGIEDIPRIPPTEFQRAHSEPVAPILPQNPGQDENVREPFRSMPSGSDVEVVGPSGDDGINHRQSLSGSGLPMERSKERPCENLPRPRLSGYKWQMTDIGCQTDDDVSAANCEDGVRSEDVAVATDVISTDSVSVQTVDIEMNYNIVNSAMNNLNS